MRHGFQKALVLVGAGVNGFITFELLRRSLGEPPAVFGDVDFVSSHVAKEETVLACILAPRLGPADVEKVRGIVRSGPIRVFILTAVPPADESALFMVKRSSPKPWPETVATARAMGIDDARLRALAAALKDY